MLLTWGITMNIPLTFLLAVHTLINEPYHDICCVKILKSRTQTHLQTVGYLVYNVSMTTHRAYCKQARGRKLL